MRLNILAPIALLTSLSAGFAHASGPEIKPADSGIFGGSNSLTCAWPSTVSLNGCTGTLVHPEVVIYAAHCGANIPEVILGENNFGAAARRIGTEYCRLNPAYGSQGGTDHAYCKLSEPVTDVPIVPILMGCETEILTPGREVVVVGFGQADISPPSGTKSEVYTRLNGISNNEANIGGDGKDACFGDSGGPAFVRLASEVGGDDTWRVFGIVSYGAQDCLGPSFYSMMHIGMPWFESELASEGIDLTPCHDSEGNWAPTPLCQSFPLDPGTPYGNWGNGCSDGAPLSGPSAMCGDPFEPEDVPPEVSLSSPQDGTMLETNGEPNVLQVFTAEASDPGSGIQHVRIQVDGNDINLGTDSAPPYEWELALPPGAFVFNVVARDWSGNETVSNYVGVGIDQPAPEPPMEETGEDSGEESGGESGDTDASSDTGSDAGGPGLDTEQGCACSATPTRGGLPLGALSCLGLLALCVTRRRREA